MDRVVKVECVLTLERKEDLRLAWRSGAWYRGALKIKQ